MNTDRVELSEALRSILDDSYSEADEQKENIAKNSLPRAKLNFTPPLRLTPRRSPRNVLRPTGEQPLNSPRRRSERKKGALDAVHTPPKKRRHANQVIILRRPHSKSRKQSPPPQRLPEFTVDLETGGAMEGSPTNQTFVPLERRTPPRKRKCSPDNLSYPSQSRDIATPGSEVQYLDAAIESQIKEELESGLPVLDGLDLTASPLCHFTDGTHRNLFSELSSLDDVTHDIPWEATRQNAAGQMARLDMDGKFCLGDESKLREDQLLTERLILRAPGMADDSLTNITWLKRMSAPDLDPNLLQTAQITDPRFERPPYSYSTLIQFAISSARSGKMTLREVYAWIEETFPFFKTAKAGWKNSIRHNLSLHKIFVREPPLSHGQPAFWTLRPGTVVRLPERRMFVADTEHGGTLLEEVAPPPPLSLVQPIVSGYPPGVPPMVVGGATAMPRVIMLPRPGATRSDGLARSGLAPEVKVKKPPLILPRGSQPYALVPVPLLLDQNGHRTIGDRLNSIVMATAHRPVVSGRKVVPIAPKVVLRPPEGSTADARFGGNPLGNVSSGSDSGIDTSGVNVSHATVTAATHEELPPLTKRRNCRKSLPQIREDLDDDSFTAFFEAEEEQLSPLPLAQPAAAPAVSTPCKPEDDAAPVWLSPLRGLTPLGGRSDSGICFREDLGLTPIARSARRAGSLDDFGLPGLTPERGRPLLHDASFGQMFSDLNASLDMGIGEGLGIGNLSWLSPNKQ